MYKFLLCFLIGILIYNYINSKNGFNIGIPEYLIGGKHKDILSKTPDRIYTNQENNVIMNIENEYYIWLDESDHEKPIKDLDEYEIDGILLSKLLSWEFDKISHTLIDETKSNEIRSDINKRGTLAFYLNFFYYSGLQYIEDSWLFTDVIDRQMYSFKGKMRYITQQDLIDSISYYYEYLNEEDPILLNKVKEKNFFEFITTKYVYPYNNDFIKLLNYMAYFLKDTKFLEYRIQFIKFMTYQFCLNHYRNEYTEELPDKIMQDCNIMYNKINFDNDEYNPLDDSIIEDLNVILKNIKKKLYDAEFTIYKRDD